MIWYLAVLLVISLVAGAVVRGRMLRYRNDQRWLLRRGYTFGVMPIALWPHDIYRRSEYAPGGQRLIPIALTLEVISMALGIACILVLT